MKLPLFINSKNRFIITAIMFACNIQAYLWLNHHPRIEPAFLPMTFVDQWIPFIPQTIWIYCSEYLFFFFIFFMSKDQIQFNKHLYSFVMVQIIGCFVFYFYPTTYPRIDFQLPTSGVDPLSISLFTWLRGTDSPNNCFPSLHVSSVINAALLYLHDNKPKFKYLMTWAVLIALSTMTTKQHYLADVISGILLAVASYVFFFHIIGYQKSEAQ